MVGADVNTLDANKNAPLHLALKRGHTRVAKDLLIGGADHDVCDGGGDYPIHLAAGLGHDEVVLSLIRREANPGSPQCRRGDDSPWCRSASRSYFNGEISPGWGC